MSMLEQKPTTVKIEVRMDGELHCQIAMLDAMVYMKERFKINVLDYMIQDYKIDPLDQDAHVFTFLVGI